MFLFLELIAVGIYLVYTICMYSIYFCSPIPTHNGNVGSDKNLSRRKQFWKMSKESNKLICIISLNNIRYMLYYIDKYICMFIMYRLCYMYMYDNK